MPVLSKSTTRPLASRHLYERLGERTGTVWPSHKNTAILKTRKTKAAAQLQDSSSKSELSVQFSNDKHEQCTVVTICSPNKASLLVDLTTTFEAKHLLATTAEMSSMPDGDVCNIFHVTDENGNKLSEDQWPELEQQLLQVLLRSSRSSMPAIHGVRFQEEELPSTFTSEADAAALEVAASEMAEAAASLVCIERELTKEPITDPNTLRLKQLERSEASSRLERKMEAMQALLTGRRTQMEQAVKKATPQLPAFLEPPPIKPTGPAAGNGYEIILQAFNWESCKEQWYRKLSTMSADISNAGFTSIWLPPASNSVSPQGYLPRDLYDLNTPYGTEAELRELIAVLHENGLKAIADVVINHRCAHYQSSDGKWNVFGGRLAWDKSSICSNNPIFGGTGSRKSQEDYSAAPNIDHSQDRVRQDISGWLRWLRTSIGYDGWRFDFVKGYDGKWAGEYVNATVPELAFGEYWDTCSYSDGVLSYNQDAHRQRTIDWCDATGGTCAAFDFTLKGILQEAVQRKEYWRLIDGQGRPPGVLGLWPSRAITFLENHDTGSTLQHWPFPWQHAAEGYAYLLTHPGTPCIFLDHYLYDENLKSHILKLVAIRKKHLLNNKSEVSVCKAYNDLYAATIDGKIAMKIGPASWSPAHDNKCAGKEWKLLHSGPNFAVWQGLST